MDSPEDLTGETTAQIGLYAHPCQDNGPSVNNRGLNSCYPFPACARVSAGFTLSVL